MNKLSTLYDENYGAWAKRTVDLLKAGEFSPLDIDHLVEELEDMGKSEQRELENRLRVLLSHLLKWQYQYLQLSERWKDFEGKDWKNTITIQRTEINIHLRKYPGVGQFLPGITVEAYQDARELAAEETDLLIDIFPTTCPYTQQQILNKSFYPAMKEMVMCKKG